MPTNRPTLKHLSLILLLAYASQGNATIITDNFTGGQAQNPWVPLGYACLTAGDGGGTIPACNLPQKDAVGSGALRLTPAKNDQTGAILSNFTFPSTQGLQVTFTSYTYGGTGADGISFFLTDGTKDAPTKTGTPGGSLGYSCSNYKGSSEGGPDGIANGYLGLGIDEYGNFLNGATFDNKGNLVQRNDNTSSGIGFKKNTIGLRGSGNVTWDNLNSSYPNYYPGTLLSAQQEQAIQNTCKTGFLWDYSSPSSPKQTQTKIKDYNFIPGSNVTLTTPISSTASSRAGAKPITYKLILTPSGLLTFLYSYNNGNYQSVLVNKSITSANGAVPSSFRFGFAGSTGGSTNIHEITCFQASPTQSSSSVGANTIQSGEVKTGTQIYLAYYNANNWWGSVVSEPLVFSNNNLTASTVANWDASCVLTGGACPSMGTDANGNALNTLSAQTPSNRTILTWNGSKGVPLQWSDLTSAQQSTLNGSDSAGKNRLNWLRGDRSQEQTATPAGNLRARTGVLGDIIDSSPTVVGAPSATALPSTWGDLLYPAQTPPENSANSTNTYDQFVSSNATRTNIVYVGGNDGLLHGFRSGSNNTDGSYNSANNDGKELLAFMPASVLSNSNVVDLTSPTYGHDYFVDATPVAGDVFYGGQWHTWLVGGVGMGGKEIFALDVTDPSQFSEANAANLVKGDWTSASLGKLGNTVGTPIITRLHNGQWAIIFGNGLNSGTSAGVYIGLIDSTTGAVTFKFLDTGVGSSTNANGIAYVTSADLDNDHVTDYLYAGDQKGNIWRFNLTSSNSSDWHVSNFGNSNPTPLYVAKDSSGNLQPITTAVAVASSKIDNNTRVMILFGTGQKTPATSTSADKYATGTQTFYGIWDWDMTNWNNGINKTASNVKIPAASVQYAALSRTQTFTRTNLLAQSLVSTTTASTNGAVLGYRSLSTASKVCWKGSKTCGNNASNNTQFGWYFDLPTTGEQIIYNPVIIGNAVVVNTAIPPNISSDTCNPGQQTGWTMAFDIASGGGLAQGFFPDANGSFNAASDGSTVSGIQLNGVGSPYSVTVNGSPYLVTQTSSGTAAITKINPQGSASPGRVSWRELVNQ
ncbi:pilus assembly protein [Halothiobacillus sp. DCM-1]|uniref:pilus assembly protein n=1 Tax=Halothiobacillus sp. DCM-1 TaxID=3112558 RepID=UPI0032484EE7